LYGDHIVLDFEPLNRIIDEVKQESRYSEQARYRWLVQKIGEMRLTHSKLLTEAESRVSRGALSWSEMIFTDLFGPDLQIIGNITQRLDLLEMNLRKYYSEALELYETLSED
jgi:hypothetical protein